MGSLQCDSGLFKKKEKGLSKPVKWRGTKEEEEMKAVNLLARTFTESPSLMKTHVPKKERKKCSRIRRWFSLFFSLAI